MNRLLSITILLSAIFFFDSCSILHIGGKKRHRIAADTTNKIVSALDSNATRLAQDTTRSVQDTTGLMKTLVDMALPIFNNRLQYTTFTGKSKVHFEGPEDKQDFTANIRVKKDTAIWVDITALGGMVHAARAYITPDSFFMINYIQKTASKLSLKDVGKILPTQVDFATLQNMIIGEPLRNGNIRNVVVQGTSLLLRVQDDSYVQHLEYRKTDSSLTVNQVNTLAANGPQAILKYDNFEMFNARKVPVSRSVNIQNGNDRFLLEMDLQNVEFEKQLEMPFSIPKSFSIK